MFKFARKLCFAAAFAAATVAPLSAMADDKVVVTYSTKSFAFMTYYAANAMGYFKDQGIEIEEVRTGTGSKALAALVGKDADVYVGSTASIFTARSRGIDVKIIAPVVTQLTSSVVVSKAWAEKHGVTADSPLPEKLAALRGARIVVTGAGSGSDQALRYVAREAGLDPDRDMTIVVMGNNPATYISAMEMGHVDGFCISPPETHTAIQNFGSEMLVNTAAGEIKSMDGYFYIGLISRQDWLQQNPELATKMVRALQVAMNSIHDPAEDPKIRDAVHAMYYSDSDRKIFDAAWKDQLQSVPRTVMMNDSMLEKVAIFTNSFSEQKIDLNLVPDVYTNEIAEKSARQSN